jgi:hypothetical protein
MSSELCKMLLLRTVLSLLNPVHTHTLCFFRIDISFNLHLYQSFPSGLFPSGFPTKISYTFFVSRVHAVCLYLGCLIFHLNNVQWNVQIGGSSPYEVTQEF